MSKNKPSRITVIRIFRVSFGRLTDGSTGAEFNLEFTSLNNQNSNTFKDTVQNQILTTPPSAESGLGNITSVSSS